MEKSLSELDLHVFVCTNKKDKKVCCADRGAEALRQDLKEWCRAQPELRHRVRINASGCLDRCQEGIAVAVYPGRTWFTKVTQDDAQPLKNMITELISQTEAKIPGEQ